MMMMMLHTLKRAFLLRKKWCKARVNRPINAELCLVEVIHYVTDTVDRRQYDKKQSENTFWPLIRSHRRASFDFHQTLRDDRGGPCHHFTLLTFCA